MNGEYIIIYDLLITIDYFSVASVLSVANTLFEKTKPICRVDKLALSQ